jgi:hypothetical protein
MSFRTQELPEIADDDDLGQMYLGLLRFVKPSERDAFTGAISSFYNRAYNNGQYERESKFFEAIQDRY